MRKCPICKGESHSVVKIITLAVPDSSIFNNTYTLIKCNNCCFIYANVNYSQTTLDEYYVSDSKYESLETASEGAGGITKYDKIRMVETVNLVKKYISVLDPIIDIGCANGGLLYSFKKEGFLNIKGLDPSYICAKRTENLVNCECYNGSFFTTKIFEKFQLITVSHVLEHVVNVGAFILKLSNLLNENGLLYIECPDANGYFKNFHGPFQEFNTEHINHFTLNDFINIAAIYDFEILENEKRLIKIGDDSEYAVIYCILKKTTKKSKLISKKSNKQLSKYINYSDLLLKNLKYNLKNYTGVIYLYGIGQLAYKIIPILEELKIAFMLFDGNINNINKTINGNTICDRNELKKINFKNNGLILVSSIISYHSILKDLKALQLNIDDSKIIPINNLFQ